MKRWLCIVLALVLALAPALSGCSALLQPEAPADDRVIVTFLTMSYFKLDGLGRIEDAINAIAAKKAGVTVELMAEDVQASFTDYPLWLSHGKRVDLMVLNYQDIQSYVKNGQLLPLDDLLAQYGADIQRLMADGVDLASGTTLGGQVYGLSVPGNDGGGVGGGLWIPRRYLEEAGFAYDAGRIYTMQQLDGLFAQLKALYPDSYPLGLTTAGNTFSVFQYFYGLTNPFGVGDVSGSLDAAGERVVNFYASEEYREFLGWMRAWYQAGYIPADAAYAGAGGTELVKSGAALSLPHISSPGMVTAQDIGEEVVCLRLSPVRRSNSSSRGIFWVIPATCQDPAAAMRFLNLMYSDTEIVNLLVWGEAGVDYRFLDEAEGIITYPEGVTPQNADYYNPFGLYGDMRLAYSLHSNALKTQLEEYAAKTVYIGQRYKGFLFDELPVATQAWQVQQVLERYLPVLESGSVELEENYAAFLAALTDAGIDEVIAEKQRQLDAWLAGQ